MFVYKSQISIQINLLDLHYMLGENVTIQRVMNTQQTRISLPLLLKIFKKKMKKKTEKKPGKVILIHLIILWPENTNL